ncbi:Phenylacetic acid catabolic protein [Sinisalibacter lacisalsi]|uniref:Ring-oxidation complex protein 1 in the phenylacetic acid catabolism pathway n=1 Tax=Sinisalibacter lacisalsi TaxID=1526570 RepID=A0ABQ1QUN8_9RHOB|nr:Phenylacetic acid catabolic protein [Sinisalibacter lacisalsi]GGD47074.1 ring-oxidation complex protein 1 in the phenylacetic acid catabolism pathway [Sinisalibacter lacisalsi]
MKIEEYLAQGGVLTSPENAPPRYRAELLRLMATFVDSELAAAAGFAEMINAGPGIPERIAAARIVMEKTAHAGRVLRVMGDFGANTARYVGAHPWAARLPREADIGTTRREGDMRLSVFNYPLSGWADSVAMHLLMGLAADEQLGEFARVSYGPLAEVFREIAPVEAAHTASARKGMERLIETGTEKAALQASVDYWWPRVAVSFGHEVSTRAATLAAFGLRHQTNAELRGCWERRAATALADLGLTSPEG